MRVFLVGANSYIGKHLARCLLEKGHTVAALARRPEIADTLRTASILPVPGEILEIADVTHSLAEYDACVWMSFIPFELERTALERLLSALPYSGKAFIFTSGTSVLGIPNRAGEWSEDTFTETDAIIPPPWLTVRRDTEEFVRSFAQKDVRAIVVRPPMVWGHGASRQIPWIFETVMKKGMACYIGKGLNVYSHVHVDDLAELYSLALEKGIAGALYHAVAGEENFRSLAQAVGQVCGCRAQSVGFDTMAALIGASAAATAFAMNSRSRCPRAQTELGWFARKTDLVDDIRQGSYRERFGSTRGAISPFPLPP